MTLIGNVGKLTRYAALVSSALLLALTRPDGSSVWVRFQEVYWFAKPAPGQCEPQANTRLSFGTVFLCVQETPEQIKELLR